MFEEAIAFARLQDQLHGALSARLWRPAACDAGFDAMGWYCWTVLAKNEMR